MTRDETHPTTAAEVCHAFAIGADGRFLSGRDSGLWTSDDQGQSWRLASVGPPPARVATVTSLALGPENGGAQTMFAGALGAVVTSAAGGRRWRAIALPPPAPLVTCLAVSPVYAEDGVILAGTLEDGVLRSDDRGEHWRRWNFGLIDLTVYAIVASPGFAADETLFAGTETGLYKSENGGRSWRETAFPPAMAPVLALTIDRAGTAWAGTDRHGIWRSPDAGGGWHRVETDAAEAPVNGFLETEHALLAVLPAAVLIATNHGERWQTAIAGLSEGGGIAGVAIIPRRPASGLALTTPAGHPAGTGGDGLEAREAGVAAGGSTSLRAQLRNGSVRAVCIEHQIATGEGNR